jgi:hypothetical protein
MKRRKYDRWGTCQASIHQSKGMFIPKKFSKKNYSKIFLTHASIKYR